MYVGLIACGFKKSTVRECAKDMYRGDLFKKSRRYVEHHCAAWAILSAKHGLLMPDDAIDPYNVTLNDMMKPERKAWAYGVLGDIALRLPEMSQVVILAGNNYREYLEESLSARMPTWAPLRGLGIGQQMAWLDAHTPDSGSEVA